MFSILEGARLLRDMASAIRAKDFVAIVGLLKTIAEKAGFGPEVDAITKIVHAVQAGPDWQALVDGLSEFLDLLSTHLEQPLPVMAPGEPGQDGEAIATQLEAIATELDQQTIDTQAVGTPQLDPATLIMLVQLVIQAVRWWRERQQS